ncbi:Hint domain-containing protein [Roseicitreum antarcticum]|uniref:Hint domain-containing protein n=1 Tax=Roseicitreum antarcticum TaxID=564137 RepID=A0A1H3CI04_9RHOB|nr:Hint domain-containing protein [Roseicitreum antarcticum]SDX53109.1 Hint domain-containing protein [Roseicitreum antarcticum]
MTTLNDLIFLTDDAPPITTGSQGVVYDLDQMDRVVDGVEVTLPDDRPGAIGVGDLATIDGVEYRISEMFDYWATVTVQDPVTGDISTVTGQFFTINFINDAGDVINTLAPGDSLTDPATGWTGAPIVSVEVFTPPTVTEFTEVDPATDVSKVGRDDETPLSCFTVGTMIDVLGGRKAVEDLRPGDMVLTRDNGYLPLAWTGSRVLDAAEIAETPDYAPVRIAVGALGDNLPERPMLVSPQHRMLVTNSRAELMFGEREVLVPAVHMVGLPGISRVEGQGVTYVHIMFDQHEILRADGAWSESYQPGVRSVAGLNDAQRRELFALFPELADAEGLQNYVAARMTLRHHEARALLVA